MAHASAADARDPVRDRGGGRGGGRVGLFLQQDVERYSAEIGYWLGEAFWGRGIATAVVRGSRTTPSTPSSSAASMRTCSTGTRAPAGCWRRPGTCSKGGCAGGGEGRVRAGRVPLRQGPGVSAGPGAAAAVDGRRRSLTDHPSDRRPPDRLVRLTLPPRLTPARRATYRPPAPCNAGPFPHHPTCRGMDIAPSLRSFPSQRGPMNRALYVAGWGYVALCGLVLADAARRRARGRRRRAARPRSPPFRGGAGEWFAQVKPFCNAVEVEVRQQQLPPPATVEGAGYSAACYALAGKIERARDGDRRARRRRPRAGRRHRLRHRPSGGRRGRRPVGRPDHAARGRATSPTTTWRSTTPGMSEYILGQMDFARTHLTSSSISTTSDGRLAEQRPRRAAAASSAKP